MEKFFLVSSSFDDIELKELLIRRYHSLSFINEMDIREFVEFCNYAREKEQSEELYRMYCGLLPTWEEYRSFEWFKDVMTGKNIDRRPLNEIEAEIEDLKREAGCKDGS